MAVDALVADIEALAGALAERPGAGRGAAPLGVGVGDVVGQRGHARAHPSKARRANRSIDWPRLTGKRSAPGGLHITSTSTQKVAIVTGAGSGIGKASALALMKEGYAV